MATAYPKPIIDDRIQPKVIPTSRPIVDIRAAEPGSEPKIVEETIPTSSSVKGTATWYCLSGVSRCHYKYSGGMYAAAGSELRVGKWRGRVVTVCQGDDCIKVKLIDWCACKGARIIDLYGDAFRRLAPLSSGTIPVKVSW